ncbi:MAG: hypothetical protein KGJ13_02010 [Patescibacteria group bacterium]|nr:hypothetical protein [Patescibacteria group bacterium]
MTKRDQAIFVEATLLQSRLASAIALAKDELKIVCDEYCGYGFMPRQHDEKCLSFQQRIKELENQ